MTVEELIKKYEHEVAALEVEKVLTSVFSNGIITAKIKSHKSFIQDLKIIEHNPKVKLPQRIAEYLKESKGWDHCYQAYRDDAAITLQHALEHNNYGMGNQVKKWFKVKGNDELFAQAWLDGDYEIEEEPNQEPEKNESPEITPEHIKALGFACGTIQRLFSEGFREGMKEVFNER